MEYRPLGNSGIEVSPVCIGGMCFGEVVPGFHKWVIGPDETREVIARAFDSGITYFDTANTYAAGTSEEYIGRALKDLRIPREQIVLQTKVFFNEGALSAAAIAREIDGSLRRLQTDYVDVYVMHRFDYSTPIEETLGALDALVQAGKVRAVGASAMFAYQLHDMQICARDNGFTPISVMQNHYNLLYREDEREMIPVCREFNVAVTPYSPLASGHLTRPTWDSNSVRSKTDETMRNKYDSTREADMRVVAAVEKVAMTRGCAMADVALAWLMAKGCMAVTVGCSKPERVDDAVRGVSMELTNDEITALEEPYVAHPLVGPLARPGESPLAGTTVPPRAGK